MGWLSVEFLSQAQFALAAFFHFLFVALALGLSLLVAVLQTRHYRHGDETDRRAADFWERLFRINFSLVVVTGLALVFQLGTNWPGLSAYAGGVIGPLLAVWAGLLFFLAPACLAVWRAGREQVGEKIRLAAIWLAALAGNASILWLCLAGGWMQNPGPGVSFVDANGVAELVGFGALFANPYGWGLFAHAILGAWTLGGFFVLGVSALRLFFPRRGSYEENEADREIFRRSARLAGPFTLAAVLGLGLAGYLHAGNVTETQPAKLAAMAARWDNTADASLYLAVWPDQANESNLVEALPLPGGLGLLARGAPADGLPGLKDFPREDRPPVFATALSFRLMLGLGVFFLLLAGLAALCRNSLEKRRWLCRLLILNLPLPCLALAAGWVVAEAGRQPWIVYQVMRTAQALPPSQVTGAGSVGASLAAFCLIYAGLGLAALYLTGKAAANGLDLRRRKPKKAEATGAAADKDTA